MTFGISFVKVLLPSTGTIEKLLWFLQHFHLVFLNSGYTLVIIIILLVPMPHDLTVIYVLKRKEDG